MCVLFFQRKPVQQLTILPVHKKLLALVDGNNVREVWTTLAIITSFCAGFLYVMHMSTLELFDTGQRVARVSAFHFCHCIL